LKDVGAAGGDAGQAEKEAGGAQGHHQEWLVLNTGVTGYIITMYIHSDKKENKIVLIQKEIQSGAAAKSYMTNSLLRDEEMRKYLTIYGEAVSHI
jgi:hypothetical protein